MRNDYPIILRHHVNPHLFPSSKNIKISLAKVQLFFWNSKKNTIKNVINLGKIAIYQQYYS